MSTKYSIGDSVGFLQKNGIPAFGSIVEIRINGISSVVYMVRTERTVYLLLETEVHKIEIPDALIPPKPVIEDESEAA